MAVIRFGSPTVIKSVSAVHSGLYHRSIVIIAIFPSIIINYHRSSMDPIITVVLSYRHRSIIVVLASSAYGHHQCHLGSYTSSSSRATGSSVDVIYLIIMMINHL